MEKLDSLAPMAMTSRIIDLHACFNRRADKNLFYEVVNGNVRYNCVGSTLFNEHIIG